MGDKPCQCHHVGNGLKRAYERVGALPSISFNTSILFNKMLSYPMFLFCSKLQGKNLFLSKIKDTPNQQEKKNHLVFKTNYLDLTEAWKNLPHHDALLFV